MINPRRSGPLIAVLIALAATATPSHAAVSDPACERFADFDGNGAEDLVAGVFGEGLPGAPDAGAAAVLYGSSGGIGESDSFLSQLGDVPGAPELLDSFGWSIAPGRFNLDDLDDLAIGVPGENVDAGGVHVFYRTASGFTAHDFFSQAGDVPGNPEPGDGFGGALAAGDFNDDGIDELAIAAPGESLGTAESAGSVTILKGTASGLTTTDATVLSQGSGTIDGVAESGDYFGMSLVACDFDDNGGADLAVGINESIAGSDTSEGAVQVFWGSPASGLDASGTGDMILTQGGDNGGEAESGDGFGTSLAAGDVNGDARADLIVGVPNETVDGVDSAGMIHVFHGAPVGFGDPEMWHQDSPEVKGQAGPTESFGYAVAAGDVDQDGYDDVAAGVPGDYGGKGSVALLHGSASGLGALGDEDLLYTQDGPGVPGNGEVGDFWGAAVTMRDLDGNDADDLAVGAGYENIGSITDAGAVTVIYGVQDGSTRRAAVSVHQDSDGIKNSAERYDLFGFAVG